MMLIATIAVFLGYVFASRTAGAAGGLQGRYYAAKSGRDAVQTLTATKPALERVEAVDLDWGKNAQARPAQNFLAQWHGCVEASADGDHVFRVEASGAARVVLDGRIIVDVWSRVIPTTADSLHMRFQKGKRYAVIVEHMNPEPGEGRKDSYIRLLWKTPGAADFIVVPAAALTPELPEAELAVTRIRFLPRAGHAARMKGGRFTGSNESATNGFVPLAEIVDAPADGQWMEIPVKNTAVYRYVKYEAPKGGWGNVAEIEFYHGPRKLPGQPFGTVGSRDNSGNDFGKALDGDPGTFFDGAEPDNQYAGIDLGEASQTAAPTYKPASGFLDRPTQIYLASTTPQALIRYTADSSIPTVLHGDICSSGGIPLMAGSGYQGNVTLTARAFKPGLADSLPSMATYKPGKGEFKRGLVTFHTGNSLMDTVVNGSLQTVTRSAGLDHTVLKATIPGAPTDFLWTHFNKKSTEPPLSWLEEKAPVDCLITQPFSGHGRAIDNEVEYTGKFFDACRKFSPKAQLWIYQQWPSRSLGDVWSRGTLALGRGDLAGWKAKLKLLPNEQITDRNGACAFSWKTPPRNFEEAVAFHRRYFEILHEELRRKYPDQMVPIIPAGPAMVALKQEIEAGRVPGMRYFFEELFADNGHQTHKGRYFVSLLFMSSLYQQSFEGKVTEAGSGLTPDQAKIFQRIAWETVRKDPLSGVKLLKK
jgi:hypothetical protein